MAARPSPSGQGRIQGPTSRLSPETTISSIRRKLDGNAEPPACIFTQLRVGYRMPRGEAREPTP